MIKSIYKAILPEQTRNEIKYFIRRLKVFFLKGDSVVCNCCNRGFRSFLSFGQAKRRNAQCPNCFSLERTRVLDLFLTREWDIYATEGLKILHFAPEKILYQKLSTSNHTYIDADINPANATYVIDIESISFEDNFFDLVICSHVLGHVNDEHKAISELRRVLKPQGTCLILTVLSHNERTVENKYVQDEKEKLKLYGEPDLQRLHGQDFQRRLELGGLKVEALDYRLLVDRDLREKHQLGNGEREIIFVCTK